MTRIEWTNETWNPIAGCTKVSDGCKHCYAETMAKRLAAMGQSKYKPTITEAGRWSGQIVLDEKALSAPLKRQKPTMYFVNSMSDLFHENVPDDWIFKIFDVMKQTPQHTYQILTKRPERMRNYMVTHQQPQDYYNTGWQPLPNVWLGVSVENQQAADERIPQLLKTPAAVRFLSCEPLLGPVDLSPWLHAKAACSGCGYRTADPRALGGCKGYCYDPSGKSCDAWPCPSCAGLHCWSGSFTHLDWVIVGGESGPGARPLHPDWVRTLRDQCAAAGVPFFFKQWGEWLPGESTPDSGTSYRRCDNNEIYCSTGWPARQNFGTHPDPHSGHLITLRIGKKKAGRTLDGVIHDAMPPAKAMGAAD